MEDPDRPGDHACPHTLVTSIPDGIHKHKHTHNVNRWIEANEKAKNITCRHMALALLDRVDPDPAAAILTALSVDRGAARDRLNGSV